DPLPDEDVERDESGGDLGRELVHATLRGVQTRLHRVEVEDATALDHDLTVERRLGRQDAAECAKLRKVAQERPRVPRPQAQLAASVLEESAEAVPLRLVLPLVTLGELTNELRLHGRERNRAMQVPRAFDGLARADPRTGHGSKLLRSRP